MAPHEMNPIDPSRYSGVLELLKFELNFLEQGGDGPSAVRPYRSRSIFLDSPVCLNFNSIWIRPRAECPLMYFVPIEHQFEAVACYHIPLSEAGATIRSIRRTGSHKELEETIKNWLRSIINRLEEMKSVGSSVPKTRGLRRALCRFLAMFAM